MSNNLPHCFWIHALFMCSLSQIAEGLSRVCLHSQEQTGASGQLPGGHPWCLLLFGSLLKIFQTDSKIKLSPRKFLIYGNINVSSEQSATILYIWLWLFRYNDIVYRSNSSSSLITQLSNMSLVSVKMLATLLSFVVGTVVLCQQTNQ